MYPLLLKFVELDIAFHVHLIYVANLRLHFARNTLSLNTLAILLFTTRFKYILWQNESPISAINGLKYKQIEAIYLNFNILHAMPHIVLNLAV